MGVCLLGPRKLRRVREATGLDVLRAATTGNAWRDLAVRAGDGHYHVAWNRVTGEIADAEQGGWASCAEFGPEVGPPPLVAADWSSAARVALALRRAAFAAARCRVYRYRREEQDDG